MIARSLQTIFVWLLVLIPIALAAAAPPPQSDSNDEQAALKEFAALDRATQEQALASVRRTANKKSAPAASPSPVKTAPPTFTAADPTKLPTFGKPGPGAKAIEEPTLQSWLEHNVEIRNSFYDSKQVDSPAKLSWTRNKGESSFYLVDAAIVGTMFFKHPRSFTFLDQDVFVAAYPVFEAHISTKANTATKHNSQDSLLYALPLTFTYGTRLSDSDFDAWMAGPTVNDPGSKYRSSDWIEGGEFILNPAYRSDQDAKIKAFEGGAYWKPGVWVPVGLNVRRRLIKDILTARWDPMLGIEVGEYDSGSKLLALMPKDYVRGMFRVHLDLGIGPEEQTPFTIAADYTLRHEFTSPQIDHSYSEISLIYNIDPDRAAPAANGKNMPKVDPKTGKQQFINVPGHLKVGATWKRGKDVPSFQDVDTFTAWVGLQF